MVLDGARADEKAPALVAVRTARFFAWLEARSGAYSVRRRRVFSYWWQ